MSHEERLRRPEPARTEPIRQWSRLFDTSAPGAEGEAATDAGAAGVAEGVKSGYRVIEDYLREGQSLAHGLASGSTDATSARSRFQEVTEQLLRDGLLWWTQLAGIFASLTAPGMGVGGPSSAASTPAPGPAACGLAVEVVACGHVSVRVELAPVTGGVALGIHPLHAPGPTHPTLEDVRAQCLATGPRLYLRVPDSQPPGTYSGVLFRLDTGEPCGTVTARVGSDEQ